MSNEQANKAIMRRAIEEIWNKGNLHAAEELTDPKYVGHMPGNQDIVGVEAVKKSIATFKTAFPNARMHIESQVAEGDEVVTSLVLEGTHKGELKTSDGKLELHGTGHAIKARGTSRVRIKDGKVVEEWVTWDEQSAMQAIGAPGLRPSYK